MNYTQISPPGHLRNYIQYFGVLEGGDPGAAVQTFKIITDGCPGMIFQENADSFTSVQNKPLPQLFLHGLFTRHSEKKAQGRFNNIGVYFRPAALKTIFGLEAHELTDRYFDLGGFSKEDLTARLMDAGHPQKRIAILAEFITKQIGLNKSRETTKLNAAVGLIESRNADFTIKRMRLELNLSERSLERLFRSGVGISPKLFSRITRFQAALHQMRGRKFSRLSDLAYDFQYTDQSHYLREFKEFSGVSPKQFLRQATEQVVNFPEWKV